MPLSPNWTRGKIGKVLRQAIFVGGAVLSLTPWSSPLFAIGLGSLLSLLLTNPNPRLGQTLSEFFLQLSVILLGFDMSFTLVAKAMISNTLPAAVTVFGGILIGLFLGKVLGIRMREATLVAAGTAICGGSAIVAMGSATKADDEDITVAIGTVFLLNAAALYLFPIIGHALHLAEPQFGDWAGLAIHDVSSVVAAGEAYGRNALQLAVASKLMRVIWILPAVWILSRVLDRYSPIPSHSFNTSSERREKRHFPWFIGLFLGACLARQYVPLMVTVGPVLSRCGETALVLTFFLMGTDVSRKTLRALTWRPVTQAILLWAMISTATLLFARR